MVLLSVRISLADGYCGNTVRIGPFKINSNIFFKIFYIKSQLITFELTYLQIITNHNINTIRLKLV